MQRETAEDAVRNQATNMSTLAFLEEHAEVNVKPRPEGDQDIEFGWQALKGAES